MEFKKQMQTILLYTKVGDHLDHFWAAGFFVQLYNHLVGNLCSKTTNQPKSIIGLQHRSSTCNPLAIEPQSSLFPLYNPYFLNFFPRSSTVMFLTCHHGFLSFFSDFTHWTGVVVLLLATSAAGCAG